MSENSGNTITLTNTGDENIACLLPAELARVQEIKNRINATDPQAVIGYGVRVQRDIAESADSILSEVRASGNSNAGGILNSLVLKIKETGIETLGGETAASKIPFIGGLINPVGRFTSRYEKVAVEIEKIADELDTARMQMLKDITLLDIMYNKTLEHKKNLDIYIAAAWLKLKELETQTLPTLAAKKQQTGRQEDVQQYNDIMDFINSLDKKISDLKISRMIAIQTGLQIKLIQSGNQALVEKIQGSVLNTIPLWKNQVVIAITLLRQKKALKMQNNITNATSQLLENNAASLKENAIAVAKEQEKGPAEIETLKRVNSNLISTIEETLQVQADSRIKRRQAEDELAKIEEQLSGTLTTLKKA